LSVDKLSGQAGRDRFFANLNEDIVKDRVADGLLDDVL